MHGGAIRGLSYIQIKNGAIPGVQIYFSGSEWSSWNFPGGHVSLIPTDFFTTLELQNSSHNVLQLHNIRRSPFLETLNL